MQLQNDAAVVTALALNPRAGFLNRKHTLELGAKLLDRLGCTLRGPLNYSGPLVALLHGIASADLLSGSAGHARLTYMRYQFVNVTDDLRSRFDTVMRRADDSPLHLPSTVVPQLRTDGWATILKLYAWTLTQFRVVLLVDLDVLLVESPLRALRAALDASVVFHATVEARVPRKGPAASTGYQDGGYQGVRTHLVLLRPSRSLFAVLMGNALSGPCSHRAPVPVRPRANGAIRLSISPRLTYG